MRQLLLLATLGAFAAHGACIGDGDERSIEAALTGPGAVAILCRSSHFTLGRAIVLKQDGQRITTEGQPEDEAERATLRVAGADQATAIFSRASRIAIDHLVIDGGRPALGRIEGGAALIEIGGVVSDIAVDHIRAKDPRGWSALHVAEGGGACRHVVISDNVLGPAGSPDRAWADGISFACRNGLIARNLVLDASDGGIVLFGAPGTLVEQNTVLTRQNVLLGGINLVDYKPYQGDYTGTTVRDNRIVAEGGFIKVGIALGPAAWGLEHGERNRGASVIDNRISGERVGYAIAVAGVEDTTVTGNRIEGAGAGALGPRCDAEEARPAARLVRDPASTSGVFQPDFALGHIRYAICIDPPG